MRASTPPSLAPAPGAESSAPPEGPQPRPRFPLAIALFIATFLSTTYMGAYWAGEEEASVISMAGLAYSLPLMSILLAHELGHYFAAMLHGVRASPPFFIPMPFMPFGTMGAIILMPDRIRSRNALFDIGAAGPLAGLAVALPVLAYGIAQSPVLPLDLKPGQLLMQEGHSLLYKAMLWLLKGPFPEGHDILLGPTALAGWVGLLITMINLIPAVQLDGGHVAYALFGERQELYSRRLRKGLLWAAAATGLAYGLPAYWRGARGEALWNEASVGMQWLVWWLLLRVMVGATRREHPQTDPGPLSPRRRKLAWFTLSLFVLLFMPAWLRVSTVPG
ncbi:MAG: site-2 protease family protein [Myxococcales bacterium]|nr:site-2 protease family protein [Myxococcales bacterium]